MRRRCPALSNRLEIIIISLSIYYEIIWTKPISTSAAFDNKSNKNTPVLIFVLMELTTRNYWKILASTVGFTDLNHDSIKLYQLIEVQLTCQQYVGEEKRKLFSYKLKKL